MVVHAAGGSRVLPAHGQHLLLAAGKGACDLLAALLKAGKPLINAFQVRFDAGKRLRKRPHFQVFLHRHLQKDVPTLRDLRQTHAYQFMGGNPVQILAVENDRAGTGVQKPRNGNKYGGLSGALRPE